MWGRLMRCALANCPPSQGSAQTLRMLAQTQAISKHEQADFWHHRNVCALAGWHSGACQRQGHGTVSLIYNHSFRICPPLKGSSTTRRSTAVAEARTNRALHVIFLFNCRQFSGHLLAFAHKQQQLHIASFDWSGGSCCHSRLRWQLCRSPSATSDEHIAVNVLCHAAHTWRLSILQNELQAASTHQQQQQQQIDGSSRSTTGAGCRRCRQKASAVLVLLGIMAQRCSQDPDSTSGQKLCFVDSRAAPARQRRGGACQQATPPSTLLDYTDMSSPL